MKQPYHEKCKIFALVFLQACCFFVYPQGNHIQFDHIGPAQGLSQSNVQCILRDSRGFMWFGTPDGLNKYDGYNFTIYKNNPLDTNSISNNFVMFMVESKNGDLWIATLGGGICRYDRKKENFTRYRHDPENINSIIEDNVNNLFEDKQGKLWVGTQAGLDMFDPVLNKFEHFVNKPGDKSSLSDSYIRYVFKDSRHNLWICTLNGGINLFNPANRTFTSFQHDLNNKKSICSNNVITMFEDSKHRLWLGTDGGGMDLFDPGAGSFLHFIHDENNPNCLSANSIYAINEDVENNLWVGTENGGLSIFNPSTGLFTVYKNDEIDKGSISNNSIYCIYRDPKNNMWLGNYTAGIDLADRDKFNFTLYKHMMLKNSLSNNSVLNIFEDSKRNIWIGTDGGGLNLFDPVSGTFQHFLHQPNNKQSICGNYVLTSCEDSKGNIWIGTWADGVSQYNPATNKWKHFKNNPLDSSSLNNNNAWKIFEDRQKNIWISTFGGGLDLLNPDQKSFTHFKYDKNNSTGISGNNIEGIFEDSDGDMWVCTDGAGLNLFNWAAKTFTHFLHDDKKNSISNNTLSYIWEDGDKNLWISTRNGLNKFNKKTNHFTVYTIADGLPDNTIFGILEDGQKNLWISTNKGISCFNPSARSCRNFGVSDGLQSNEFKEQAFCKTKSGMMYFGGNNGFNRFNPDSIRAIDFDPPLVVTNFQIFNKDVHISLDGHSPLSASITETKSITLPWSSTVFSFEFASLNYTASEKKRYAYMLEGFDKEWNQVGTSRLATYTHLDPGEYIFKVKGLTNEGYWSSKITIIKIIITPPFWLTWWFKLAFFIFVAGSVIAFYRFRINAEKAQKIKLQQQVNEQTGQLKLSTEEEQKARREAEYARTETELANSELKIKNKEIENAHMQTELANKELKLKNKELEQFAYVASHDLQEPLRTTSGFVELLKKQYHGKIDEKADKYLSYISDASDRMKNLIRDLLDFSRIGTQGELKEVDATIILRNMLTDIMAAVKESNAEIQYETLPVINCYPTEMKLLFQNLVINAIKFRKNDVVPQISVSAKRIEGFWQFSVRDNGIGIEKHNQEKIFDIFQRLHSRAEYAGSGIGLSHCKKIVELHHGKLWVESTPGEGSTFYFTIP